MGISNQRETSIAWTKDGKPIYNAIVWQCARAEEICRTVMVGTDKQYPKKERGIDFSKQPTALEVRDLCLPKPGGGWLLNHEVFHLFVMGGSFCHFIVMYSYIVWM